MKNLIHKRTILLTMAGSHAYGMATEKSDIDIRGIIIPTKEYFHGTLNNFEQYQGQYPRDVQAILYLNKRDVGVGSVIERIESISGRKVLDTEELDSVVYGLHKFIKLASDCNPNIIELLFTDESSHIKSTSFFEELHNNRNLFLSMKAKFTFSGYAFSQLKRIKTHRHWLINPPSHKPTREEFGLINRTLISKDQLLAAESLIKRKVDSWIFLDEELPREILESVRKNTVKSIKEIWSSLASDCYKLSYKDKSLSFDPLVVPVVDDELDLNQLEMAAAKLLGYDDNFLIYLDQERHYRSAKIYYNQYNHWKASRNKTRALNEMKYGYDTKHASHLIRLLKMGKEILSEGKVIVKRPDSQELLDVRNGHLTFDELMEYSKKLQDELDDIYESGKSPLSKKPNRKKIDELCVKLVERALNHDILL